MSTPVTEPYDGAVRVGSWLRDKYHLDRVLGEGGMATVYAATHRNKKRVAVKMLHPSLSANEDIRARFLREGYVANSVDHPGAVAVLDDDVAEDGSAFLVMELLEGDTVETVSETWGERLDAPAVLAIGYQVLDILVAAHAKGVVHRDIKPANLFVTRTGLVKILDFGIARLHEGDDSSSTRTGVHMGTPAFMSPEQASGRVSQIDARSDLWSVGATLFFLLAHRDVHLGETTQHMIMLTATVQAAPLASVEPGTLGVVSTVVDRALALDKSQRWPSAAAMRDAVAAAYLSLVGEPVSQRLLADVPPEAHTSRRSLVTEPTLAAPTGGGSARTPPVTGPVGSAVSAKVSSATMAPVSSSPSSRGRRGRRIALGATFGVALAGGLVGGVYLAGARSSSRAAPLSPRVAASVAPPQAQASSNPTEGQGAASPAVAEPRVVELEPPASVSPPERADASTSGGGSPRAPSAPRHAPPASVHGGSAKPPGAAATSGNLKPGVTDFDRQ
jgi:eukaryotic-like serine/threonine-protein kinase